MGPPPRGLQAENYYPPMITVEVVNVRDDESGDLPPDDNPPPIATSGSDVGRLSMAKLKSPLVATGHRQCTNDQ